MLHQIWEHVYSNKLTNNPRVSLIRPPRVFFPLPYSAATDAPPALWTQEFPRPLVRSHCSLTCWTCPKEKIKCQALCFLNLYQMKLCDSYCSERLNGCCALYFWCTHMRRKADYNRNEHVWRPHNLNCFFHFLLSSEVCPIAHMLCYPALFQYVSLFGLTSFSQSFDCLSPLYTIWLYFCIPASVISFYCDYSLVRAITSCASARLLSEGKNLGEFRCFIVPKLEPTRTLDTR